jgi:Ca-activated chloride channel family protein
MTFVREAGLGVFMHPWSTASRMAKLGAASGRKSLRWLPPVLRAIGLALLIVALARPLAGFRVYKDRADVVDIMLGVDVSGSMRAIDFVAGGQQRSRLYVTKEAVEQFIESRRGGAEDRYGLDRIGLVLYAGYAWTQCPLTLDYGVLLHELDQAEIDEADPKSQRTAIGSAIGLGVQRLRKSEAKSKVLILLTDGLNNAGELDPITAATIAEEFGIKIYTIGAGSRDTVRVPQQGLFGRHYVTTQMPIDDEMLQRIAEMTGGRFYRATDTKSLETAYAEISELEKTEVEVNDYYGFKEAFPAYAAAGALLLGLSLLSHRLWFDPIP